MQQHNVERSKWYYLRAVRDTKRARLFGHSPRWPFRNIEWRTEASADLALKARDYVRTLPYRQVLTLSKATDAITARNGYLSWKRADRRMIDATPSLLATLCCVALPLLAMIAGALLAARLPALLALPTAGVLLLYAHLHAINWHAHVARQAVERQRATEPVRAALSDVATALGILVFRVTPELLRAGAAEHEARLAFVAERERLRLEAERRQQAIAQAAQLRRDAQLAEMRRIAAVAAPVLAVAETTFGDDDDEQGAQRYAAPGAGVSYSVADDSVDEFSSHHHYDEPTYGDTWSSTGLPDYNVNGMPMISGHAVDVTGVSYGSFE